MNDYKEIVKSIGDETVEYFAGLKGNCAESILRTLRDRLNMDLSDDQLAMATGFGGGMGAGCACGALTGAIMAVSLETGRKPGIPSENPPRATVLAGEIVKEFQDRNKVTCCRALIPGLQKGDPERKKRCSEFVRQMSEKAAEIILQERNKAKE